MSELLSIYRHALAARLVDERLEVLARGGRIGLHPDAQRAEAVIVAATMALGESDWVFPTARDHAAALVRGVSVASYVAHVVGGANDPLSGHASPGCFCSRDRKIAPPTGQLSQHLTQAMGLAWAARLRKDASCVLALLPETAADAGDFHSAVNFAGVTKAPVVFLVRCGARGDVDAVPSPDVEVAEKGIAYGVPAAEVTEDPLEVLAAVREAADRARRGEGPTLISVGVVRKADPTQLFRPGAPGTPVEISVRGSVPDHDALDAIRRQLLAEGALDESADMLHRRELMAEIEAGVRAALDAGPPAIDSIFEHVHAELAPHLIQQREQLRKVYET